MTRVAVALVLALSACTAPAVTAPPQPPQRWNEEGLRRLERGDAALAEASFRAALEEATLVDDLKSQAEAWNNLGALAAARGRFEEARRDHAIALGLHRARGVRDEGEVRTRSNLGAALLRLGAVDMADAELASAVELATELGRPGAARLARVGRASVALYRGDARGAATRARVVAAEAEEAGDDDALAAALAVEGAAWAALGDLRAARARFTAVLALDRRRSSPDAIAGDLRVLAELAERAGDFAEASSCLARSSRIARWMGDFDRAERELRRAMELARSGGGLEAEQLAGELDALCEARRRDEAKKAVGPPAR